METSSPLAELEFLFIYSASSLVAIVAGRTVSVRPSLKADVLADSYVATYRP